MFEDSKYKREKLRREGDGEHWGCGFSTSNRVTRIGLALKVTAEQKT